MLFELSFKFLAKSAELFLTGHFVSYSGTSGTAGSAGGREQAHRAGRGWPAPPAVRNKVACHCQRLHALHVLHGYIPSSSSSSSAKRRRQAITPCVSILNSKFSQNLFHKK